MKRLFIRTLSVLILLSMVLTLSACGIRKTSEVVTPVPVVTPETVQPATIETIEAETEMHKTEDGEAIKDSMEEVTAAKALEENLPPKPDIDIYSWEYQLTNSFNSIGEYRPPYSSFEGGQGIHANIVQPATEFLQAARNAGFNVWCSRAYRNYEYQDSHYQSFLFNVAGDAVTAANRMLGPGLSDHQTGLAIDFTDQPDYSAWYAEFDDGYIKDTDLYQWLTEHCTEYGFILRYPEGKEEYYGVACEHPAHFRYVGKEAAEYIMKNNLCLEEFIMLYDESLVFLPKP